MRSPATSSHWLRILMVFLLVGALVAVASWFFWPRGEALAVALQPLISQSNTEQSRVATAILSNYHETRTNASGWSGLYWGFTFLAAALGALAGLILKFEFILKNEAVKKDVAAIFSVTAALLIVISTSGDFQRKWQANRIAAAELERTGYELLEKNGADARGYFAVIARILHNRHVAVLGSSEPKPVAAEPDKPK